MSVAKDELQELYDRLEDLNAMLAECEDLIAELERAEEEACQ